MNKPIKTFNPREFLDQYIKSDPSLKRLIKQEHGKFFIVPVQQMIKVSKLPVPPTRATAHTLIYLTSGTATMKIGFHNVSIRRNECLIVPAGQVFGYDKYEVNKGFICSFDNDFLIGRIGNSDLLKSFEFLNIWANPIIKPDLKRSIFLKQTFSRVFDEYSKHGLANILIVQSHLIAALCDLSACYKTPPSNKTKTAMALTNNFRELLHKHIRTKHLVTDYASMLNVSPNHLNKILKAVTRKSTSKWIDENLILEAKVLLVQTSDPVNQIATELGIMDQSYFSRLFKKFEGVTPMEFRRMIGKS